MHLVSDAAQGANVSGCRIDFAVGETIHTDSSRKYDIASFASVAGHTGWNLRETWTDQARRFAVLGLKPDASDIHIERTSVGQGQSEQVRVDHGGRRTSNKN